MQTSYVETPAIGREGVIATSHSARIASILSRLAGTAIKAGRAVFNFGGPGNPLGFVGDPGSVYQQPSPASMAANTTAVLASGGASSASLQTITTFNGASGGSASEKMAPGRQITLVLSSHTDWDATNAVLTGVDHRGITVSENLAIPNNGNATVTSVNFYQYITSLVIPAQTGAGGTYTIGVAAVDASITLADVAGIAVFDPSAVPTVVPSQDQTSEYSQGSVVPVLESGEIYVITEDACVAGGTPHIRVGGTGDLGAIRSDTDGGNAVAMTGAIFRFGSGANGINVIRTA